MTPSKDDPSEIGQNLFYGISVKRNYRKAFPYLFEAANRGEIHAQNLIGYCFDLGLGVKENKSQAIFWYQQAENTITKRPCSTSLCPMTEV